MSVDLSLELKQFEAPLQESIRELRRGYQTVSDYLEQTLAECDARSAELAECRRQLAEARRNLSEGERQRAERNRAEADLLNRCAAFKKQIEAQQIELAQANDALLHARTEVAQAKQRLELQLEQNARLRELCDRSEAEREAFRSEQTQLRLQCSKLAESAADAAALQSELANAQAELIRVRELAKPTDDGVSYELLAEAQAQRQQLEDEIDILRRRGEELSEALIEQRRQASEEREQWSDQIRELRRAVERQSELLAERGHESEVAGDRRRKPEQPGSNGQAKVALEAGDGPTKGKGRRNSQSQPPSAN